MVSEVLYRKWRPQSLAEVVGQNHVTQTLLNALAQGRVAHAYLFCGPRGTGKTSTGRILAKAVNCLTNGKGEPCNSCSICKAITKGSALDLIEIDAASNRGIDEIRELRERVNYSPTEARRKVYIIDEVHMLTDFAFNALLKTLEEPPPHVIFILATTEAHKLPATIISRCQRFDFRRISQGDIEERLATICREEGAKAEPWVMKYVARASGGSLRDAENLLEQLMVSYGSSLEAGHVRELLGIPTDMPLQEFAGHALHGRLAQGLRLIHGMADQGLNLRHFHRELLEHLRAIMLIRVGAEDILDIPAGEVQEIKSWASDVRIEDVTQALKLFGKADIRGDGQGVLPLETALADLCLSLRDRAKESGAPSPNSEERRVAERGPGAGARGRPSSPPPAPASKAGQSMESPAASEEEARESSAHGQNTSDQLEEVRPPERGRSEKPKPVLVNDIQVFKERWPELVEALRGMGSKGSLDALLRNACEPMSLEGETLVVGFYYPFHKSKVEDPKYRHLVERKLSEVFGAPYKIKCNLVSRDKKSTPPTAPGAPGPLVKAALEMGARIIETSPNGDG